MRLCATAQIGPADRQVALSEQQLRGLLAALTQRPAVVVLEVGCGLKLVLAAVIMSEGLPTGDAIDGSESRVDLLTTASKTSRRIIGVAASSRAPAARRRFSLTADDKKQAAATIAAAVKHAKRPGTSGDHSGITTVKTSGESTTVKQAKDLQSWAAKAKRAVPSLLELLESGVNTIAIEHAMLIKSQVEGISADKAARVRT